MKPIKSLLILAALLVPAAASAQGYGGGGGGYYSQPPSRLPGGFHDRQGRLMYGFSLGLGGMKENGTQLDCPTCDYNPLAGMGSGHRGSFIGPPRAVSGEPEAYLRFMSRDPQYAVPGGESPAGFFERCRAALEELAVRHEGETIAIVTHGLVLDSAYRAATGLALEAQRPVPLVNASLNWFSFDGTRWSAERWGDADHLGPEGVTVFGDGRG